MEQQQKRKWAKATGTRLESFLQVARCLAAVVVGVFGLSCIIATGGGGGDTASNSSQSAAAAVAGFEVPSEVSAVPTNNSSDAASMRRSLFRALRLKYRAATDSGTDYSNASTRKYVQEHALEQFDIIEQVMSALEQTHYSDAENIDAGPYKSMVAWTDENNGVEVKQLEPWIVDSAAITEDGESVLRVRCWIEEVGEGGVRIVKAELKIYESATKNEDGSYADYGVWTLNVKFPEGGDSQPYFVANASKGADGQAIVKIHESRKESFPGADAPLTCELKAIMYRSAASGYGQVSYPDYEKMFGKDAPEHPTEADLTESVKYAFNSDYLAVQKEGTATQYKDRNGTTEMTHRYGVFNAQTGADAMKTKSFGFPISYTSNNNKVHGYYGAWQGRHQIWAGGNGASIAEGTVVSRVDLAPGASAETYTVGKTFNGTFVKRTYVSADLDDIKNIPVEIWVNENYNLTYEGGIWKYCPQMDWGAQGGPQCAVALVNFEEKVGLDALIVGENDNKKNVWISRGGGQGQPTNYVYEKASSANSGDGFYEASEVNHRFVAITPRVKLNPAVNGDLWVNIGGSIYVEYQGEGVGWKEKDLIDFNQQTWTPTFDNNNDKDFKLPEGRELYINMQGTNYVVFKQSGVTNCKMELQSVANPSNAATFVPANTIFKNQWSPGANSTYELVTDPDSDDYLMLVYASIGDDDTDQQGQESASVGDRVTKDIWGLEAYDNGSTATGTIFNWEYAGNGEDWGKVTYLMDGSEYKLLSDPMLFDPIQVVNGAGETKTLRLQYDGWMQGLPMLFEELRKAGWIMTDDIADKIINIPEGTELTESSSGTKYLLKPLEISMFLNTVSDITGLSVPDISQADAADLSTVPGFTDHGMGDMPTVTTIKYSEGKKVE